MKTAWSYARFSTLSQSDNSSIFRQTESARKWCKENGYILSEDTFHDKGKSAYTGDNIKADGDGALRKFIKLHEEGKIARDAVLCIDDASRFSRLPVSQSASYFLNVVNSGIGIVFTASHDKRIITSKLIDNEPFVLQTCIAELNRGYRESADRSYKVKEGLRALKERVAHGEIIKLNNVPKYFSFDGKRYIHNPQTEIVKGIIQDILSGKSLYSISHNLNKAGTPTIRRKREWSASSVRQIAKNRTLIGEFNGVANYVPRVVSDSDFLKVQNILANNSTNRGRKGTLVNIFRSLAFCASCGRAMNIIAGEWKGVPYRYFRCSNFGRKNSCEDKSYLRADVIERDFFYNYLYQGKGKLINEEDVSEVKAMGKVIAAKTARLNAVKENIQKFIDLAETMSLEALKTKLGKLSNEQDNLKREIDELNARSVAVSEGAKDLGKWLWKEVQFTDSKGEIVESHIYRNSGKDKLYPEDEVLLYEGNLSKLEQALTDNTLREKIRVSLPSVLSKITMDSKERKFSLFNLAGKLVYRSREFPSQMNASNRWRESLKTWTKRKTAGGRLITVKRKTVARS